MRRGAERRRQGSESSPPPWLGSGLSEPEIRSFLNTNIEPNFSVLMSIKENYNDEIV